MASINIHPKTCPTLETAVAWTLAYRRDPGWMKDYLLMPEATIIRVCLKRWETIGKAFHAALSDAGWQEFKGEIDDGNLAIVDGESIQMMNGAVHMPRNLIQLLAFRDCGMWQICTDKGFSGINWAKSEAHIWKMYRCQPS